MSRTRNACSACGSPEQSPVARTRGAAHAARFVAPATAARAAERLCRTASPAWSGLDTAPMRRRDALPPSSGYQGPDPDANPSGCQAGVGESGFTPNEYLDAYDYTPLQQGGLLGQGERVALVEIDGFRTSDLSRFANCFHLDTPQINAFGVGVPKPLPPGGEATLDIEVLDAAAPDLKSINVYETKPDAADVLQAIAQPLQNPGFKPQVISVSLGLCESNTVTGVGQGRDRAPPRPRSRSRPRPASACSAPVATSARPIVSSTDSNPPAPPAQLAVNFPSSSPWVTSVGGTNFTLNSAEPDRHADRLERRGRDPGQRGRRRRQQAVRAAELAERHRQRASGGRSRTWRCSLTSRRDTTSTAPPSVDCHGRGWETFGGTSAATPLLAGRLRADRRAAATSRQAAARAWRTRCSTSSGAKLDDGRPGVLRRDQRLQRCRTVHPGEPAAARLLQRAARLRRGLRLGRRQSRRALAGRARSCDRTSPRYTCGCRRPASLQERRDLARSCRCTRACDMAAYAQ